MAVNRGWLTAGFACFLNDTIYADFGNWIDAFLSNDPASEVVAYNFDLYEGTEAYGIELIGASEYDPKDSDWTSNRLRGAWRRASGKINE